MLRDHFKTVVTKVNILSGNGDFPTILLVNYRKLCCFIFLIRLLQRKFNKKSAAIISVIEMFELVKCFWPKLHSFFYKNVLDKNIEAEMSEILRIC